MIYCAQSFGLPSSHINAGIHWRGSIWESFRYPSAVGSSARQAPTTPDTSNLHGAAVDINAAVLGS